MVLLSSGSWYIVGDADKGFPPLQESLGRFRADMQRLQAAVQQANAQVAGEGRLRCMLTRASRASARQDGAAPACCSACHGCAGCVQRSGEALGLCLRCSTGTAPRCCLGSCRMPARHLVRRLRHACPILSAPWQPFPSTLPAFALLQAGRDILWLWLAIPPRVKGRAQWASWMVRAADIPHLNGAARGSGLMQPDGPAFYLDLESIAAGAAQHARSRR